MTSFHPGPLGGWRCRSHQHQGGHRMKLHGSARTCPNSRRLIASRVLEQGWTLAAAAEAAEVLSLPLSTVSRWLKRIGLGKRSRLEPPEPPNRYERARPGELVHVDVKKLGRFRQPGHRVTGRGGHHRVTQNT